jgi:hypothetical protein
MNSAKQESLNSGLQRISMIFLVIPQCLIGRLRKQTVGFVKLNSEGVLQMEGDATAYGVVARDDTSFTSACGLQYIQGHSRTLNNRSASFA